MARDTLMSSRVFFICRRRANGRNGRYYGRRRVIKETKMIKRKMGERRLGAATLPTSRYDLFYHQIRSLRYEDAGKAAGDANAGDAGQQQSGAGNTADDQQATTLAAGENQDANAQVEAFKAKALDETTKRQAAEQQVTDMQQQMSILTANKAPDQQPQQPTDLVSQIIQRLGYQDEPYLSTEQQAQVMNAVLQAGQVTAASNQFLAQHPDFAEVVGQNNAAGQFVNAPPLQRAINKDKTLAQALVNGGPQAGILAYHIASKDPEYVASKAESGKSEETKQAEEAAALLAQQQGTQSISTVAGQGTLDKAAAIRAMSDDEFLVYKENLMAKAV